MGRDEHAHDPRKCRKASLATQVLTFVPGLGQGDAKTAGALPTGAIPAGQCSGQMQTAAPEGGRSFHGAILPDQNRMLMSCSRS